MLAATATLRRNTVRPSFVSDDFTIPALRHPEAIQLARSDAAQVPDHPVLAQVRFPISIPNCRSELCGCFLVLAYEGSNARTSHLLGPTLVHGHVETRSASRIRPSLCPGSIRQGNHPSRVMSHPELVTLGSSSCSAVRSVRKWCRHVRRPSTSSSSAGNGNTFPAPSPTRFVEKKRSG